MTTEEGPIRVGVVPRQNADTRSYKVVMNVAGDTCEYAMAPADLKATARLLAAALAGTGRPDYVVGFAPGGIAVTVALSYELDVPAVIAYKTKLGVPGELTWTEPHCLYDTFYFYGAEPGMTVLLVDDEIDSGNTICNAVEALRAREVRVLGAGCAVEVRHDGRCEGRERLAAQGLTLRSVRQLELPG